MISFPDFESILSSGGKAFTVDDIIQSEVDLMERLTEMANQKFKEALKNGDDAAMDFWHGLTMYAENEALKKREIGDGIVAIISLIHYGLKNSVEKNISFGEMQYGEKLIERKGFHKITDVIIDTLEECGITIS